MTIATTCRPLGVTFDHVGVLVSDLDKATAFYSAVFGWEERSRRPARAGEYIGLDVVFLGCAGNDHLELIGPSVKPEVLVETGHNAVVHLGVAVDDLAIFAVHCQELKLSTRQCVDVDGQVLSIWLQAPDGTSLEVFGRSNAQSNL